MSSNFANNIKHLRNEHKLTQEQFGKIFGVTRQCVANWEAGTREPYVKDIIVIAKYFNLDVIELYEKDLNNASI